ncbi:hypothetical protein [Hyphomonas jannaschiana]|uniref:Uncharacterized protein n=1 Tax=Hyphomonas jannaschiana VP2 TaxID=1280952 RepID=A0A059FGI9_9PROT|nr:hypothetical protein [Hyphomonas jannaschiana]KCZ89727.1 hypothetical protein HJA_05732 [Hyphomonas jannaschiana VP2]
MSNNPPVETLRDGPLKASIFRNEGENGPFFITVLSKTYKDERGELRDTNAFSAGDLLPVSELGRQAHHRVNELRRELALSRTAQDRPPERSRRQGRRER